VISRFHVPIYLEIPFVDRGAKFVSEVRYEYLKMIGAADELDLFVAEFVGIIGRQLMICGESTLCPLSSLDNIRDMASKTGTAPTNCIAVDADGKKWTCSGLTGL